MPFLRIKPYQSKAWLHRKYVIEKLTETQIAKLAKTSQATINRWLRFHGFKDR